ncbi:hypothetical protein Aglo03_25180 [Actinokineospora globicatena]|uniref:Uncharacterized protein n=1 Tax=Actinokineospora globicatena TaxID=103729 RepID=A0A9W6QNC6_9PSEU|nr:hypothetical protein Aglo03_25180 [Actinokineospora globicatena]
MEWIRAARYRLPDGVATVTMDRAAASAVGRPWDESEVEAKARRALGLAEAVAIDKRINPQYYSPFVEREGAWCLIRDGDQYRVQWSSNQSRPRGKASRKPNAPTALSIRGEASRTDKRAHHPRGSGGKASRTDKRPHPLGGPGAKPPGRAWGRTPEKTTNDPVRAFREHRSPRVRAPGRIRTCTRLPLS